MAIFPPLSDLNYTIFATLHALTNICAYCNNIFNIAISRDISYVASDIRGLQIKSQREI